MAYDTRGTGKVIRAGASAFTIVIERLVLLRDALASRASQRPSANLGRGRARSQRRAVTKRPPDTPPAQGPAMLHSISRLCAIAALVLTGSQTDAATSTAAPENQTRFETVDFSDQFNVRKRDGTIVNGRTFPSGDVMSTSGIPYAFGPSHGLYAWGAVNAEGDNPRVLEIETDLDGAVRVYTLISTAWGKDRPGLLAIEFLGDRGAFHRVDLVGNHLVRDYNHNRHATNRLDADNAREVWDNHHGQRLDRQTFELPDVFQGERLTRIRVVDTGQDELSRGIVFAITAEIIDTSSADRARALEIARALRDRQERAVAAQEKAAAMGSGPKKPENRESDRERALRVIRGARSGQ